LIEGQNCSNTAECCACSGGTYASCQIVVGVQQCVCLAVPPPPQPSCIGDGGVCKTYFDKCCSKDWTCKSLGGPLSEITCQSPTGPSGCVNEQNPLSCTGDDQCCPSFQCSDSSKCVLRPPPGGGNPPGGGGGGIGGIAPPNLTTTGCGTGAMEVWRLDCIFPLMQRLINWALIFAGTVALILIIYSGIRFITSNGDPKSVDASKKVLTYAIVGLVLVFSSFFIINLIAYATGVDCINLLGFEVCH